MFCLPSNLKPYANCFLVNVTPELAREWIADNNFNRPLKPRLVSEYARQIRSGSWRRTHQGIAFDERGVVIDGQHRLWAIVESGQTVPLLVFLNENPSAHESLDNGRVRSHLDVVRLELLDQTIKQKHLSSLKAMWGGKQCKCQNHLTAMELGNLYRRYHNAVRFAVDILENSPVDDSTVMGVIARAYHTIAQDRLLDFCRILREGVGVHPCTKMIVEFRDWFLTLKDRQEATRRDIYKRMENVLHAFLTDDTACDVIRDNKERFTIFGKSEQ